MVFRSLNTIFHNVPKFLPQKLKFKGGKFLFSFAKVEFKNVFLNLLGAWTGFGGVRWMIGLWKNRLYGWAGLVYGFRWDCGGCSVGYDVICDIFAKSAIFRRILRCCIYKCQCRSLKLLKSGTTLPVLAVFIGFSAVSFPISAQTRHDTWAGRIRRMTGLRQCCP